MKIRLTSTPLPAGFCALTDAQWSTLLSLVSVSTTDPNGPVNVGISPPEPDMREYPWFRLEADGSPDRIYYYWSGLWLARHALAPGSIMIYYGTVASIPTFDGGEASPTVATPTSGPMWEQFTELNAKFPLGVGTLESGTVVGVGDSGGEEEHLLKKGELPAHSHYFLADHSMVEIMQFKAGDHNIPNEDRGWKANPQNQTDSVGNDTPHNNMPPYLGVLFIRRTARLFYRQ